MISTSSIRVFKSKAFVVDGVATLSAMAALPAQATTGFTGPYAPANWTFSSISGGSVNTSGAPGSITLSLPTNNFDDPTSDYTTVSQGSGPVSFSWSRSYADLINYTIGNFILNGTATVVFADSYDTFGANNFLVSIGDTFGFRFLSQDINAPTTLTISNFFAPSAPTPPAGVPGPLPLFGAGAAYGWSRRLRRRLSNP